MNRNDIFVPLRIYVCWPQLFVAFLDCLECTVTSLCSFNFSSCLSTIFFLWNWKENYHILCLVEFLLWATGFKLKSHSQATWFSYWRITILRMFVEISLRVYLQFFLYVPVKKLLVETICFDFKQLDSVEIGILKKSGQVMLKWGTLNNVLQWQMQVKPWWSIRLQGMLLKRFAALLNLYRILFFERK